VAPCRQALVRSCSVSCAAVHLRPCGQLILGDAARTIGRDSWFNPISASRRSRSAAWMTKLEKPRRRGMNVVVAAAAWHRGPRGPPVTWSQPSTRGSACNMRALASVWAFSTSPGKFFPFLFHKNTYMFCKLLWAHCRSALSFMGPH
jgi:hypothetical protein